MQSRRGSERLTNSSGVRRYIKMKWTQEIRKTSSRVSSHMSSFAVLGLATDELATFIKGTHSDPFRILGPHRVGDDLVVRMFRPDAREIAIVLPSGTGNSRPNKLHDDGFYQAILPGEKRHCDYRVRAVRWDRLGTHAARSVLLRNNHGRGGSASFRRRPALGALRKIRRAHSHDRRRAGRLLRGLGAERAARQCGRRFQ